MLAARSEKRQLLRTQLWDVVHGGQGAAGRAFNFTLTILLLVAVAILPLEFLPQEYHYHTALLVADAVLTALFTVEYAVRIYAAPRRLRYIFSVSGIVDLFCIFPFYLGFVGGWEALRALRLLRILRLGEVEATAAHSDQDTLQATVGLVEGESVEYVVTRHPLFLLLGCIPTIISLSAAAALPMAFGSDPWIIALTTVLGLFALLFFARAWLDYSYDVIYLTNYRLIFNDQHLLGRRVNQVNYASITNVKPYNPHMWSYIFRYGSIVIDTAAEHPGQIVLHTVRKHEKAAQVIMEKSFARPRD